VGGILRAGTEGISIDPSITQTITPGPKSGWMGCTLSAL